MPDAPASNIHLEIDRQDHGRHSLREEPLAELADGDVRFRIERFALTANNITYAAFGDVLGYWDFFPAADPAWGRVPAMGWGEVVASARPDVALGGRYFGWFPMSRSIDVRVTPTDEGLRDDGEHRSAHAPIYRAFLDTDRDPFYESGQDAEDRHALLRGLFLTAFLADDFFADQDYYGARRVMVLSASSKTAIGFAECASARGLDEVVGITSAANRDFVGQLGCYDRVLLYDEVEKLSTESDAVCIDMAGNGAVLARLHGHLADRLRYSMIVGRSHHDAPPQAEAMPGPSPELFFAPNQVSKRIQDWGAEGYRERIKAALQGFVAASDRWLELHRSHGPAAAADRWQAVRGGGVPPRIGEIVSLWGTRQ